jgi:hypothetical protein
MMEIPNARYRLYTARQISRRDFRSGPRAPRRARGGISVARKTRVSGLG